MATITIVDESTQGETRSWNLDLLDETISVRELLRRRIFQEVTEYNARPMKPFQGLVQPSEVERTLNGDQTRKVRQLDWQAQYEKAVAAFQRRGYLILVDDKQVTNLDTLIELHAGSEVTFFRLVPLVGG